MQTSNKRKRRKRKKKNKNIDNNNVYSIKNQKVLKVNKLNLSTVNDYLQKIKTAIFIILNESLGGIEINLLEKFTNERLKSEFDYVTFGYSDFYHFLMEKLENFIEIEVKFKNKREK